MDNISYIERIQANSYDNITSAREALENYAESIDSIKVYKMADDLNAIPAFLNDCIKADYPSEKVDMAFLKKCLTFYRANDKKNEETSTLGDYSLLLKTTFADMFVQVFITLHDENNMILDDVPTLLENKKKAK